MDYQPITLSHLKLLTDCTGIIQHSHHSVPNLNHGYTTDDNARALVAATQYYEHTKDPEALSLAIRYLSFIHYAQTPEGRFRNVMNYERQFLDQAGTQDCFGRTMWACGYTASSDLPENVRIVARKMFDESVGRIADLDSPRAKSYSVLGLYEYLRGNPDLHGLNEKLKEIADSLVGAVREYGRRDWHWYEEYLTYGNAIIPWAMMLAGERTGRQVYAKTARDTISFLTENTIIDDRLEIIGNEGWYTRGQKRAWYDQQTVDAGYTICMYVKAYQLFGDRMYLDLARISHDWFYGNNRSGVPVYDEVTGGCFDALIPEGVNLNQGAESCICFLLAQMAMQNL